MQMHSLENTAMKTNLYVHKAVRHVSPHIHDYLSLFSHEKKTWSIATSLEITTQLDNVTTPAIWATIFERAVTTESLYN